jgi:molybdopterin molybdotransferase
MAGVVDFEDALAIVVAAGVGAAPDVGRMGLEEALGRVLAGTVLADRDQPGFDRSTRDGFAVRAAEVASGASLRVMGQVRAGDLWAGERLKAGEAISIMTGAPLPAGADAVLMVEHVERAGDMIRVADGRSLRAGENVVPRGAEARLGAEVLASGARLGAAEIALAATCGCATLRVFRRATVAIVATGDELVEVAETPGPQQIRNSNSYAIAAMVRAAGGEPQRLEIAGDTREAIRDRVARGRAADLLVFSGGVSMGEYDLVEEVLAESGAEFLFTGVRMQPGKPVVFGRLPALDGVAERYFFGLPGNPISTQVTFHCFVEPMLRMLGGEADVAPRWALATSSEAVAAKPGLTRLLPARMDGVEVRLVGWQGSGDLAANARANCYAELLPGKAYAAGDVVRVLLR